MWTTLKLLLTSQMLILESSEAFIKYLWQGEKKQELIELLWTSMILIISSLNVPYPSCILPISMTFFFVPHAIYYCCFSFWNEIHNISVVVVTVYIG